MEYISRLLIKPKLNCKLILIKSKKKMTKLKENLDGHVVCVKTKTEGAVLKQLKIKKVGIL